MKQTKETAIGLVLQLRQFPLHRRTQSISQHTYTVLGHYDGLEIRTIKKWLDFLPGNDVLTRLDEAGNQRLLWDTAQYSIRLLFPEGEASCLYDYDAWKNPEALLASYPCVSVVLINLSNSYKEENGVSAKNETLLKSFTALLETVCPKDELYWKAMHCAVFLSIGYSDFCILTADQNWKNTMRLVETLHTLYILRGGCSYPVLSTDYLIPVYNGKAPADAENIFEDMKLSVRINLDSGCTADMVLHSIPTIKAFQTSGGSDYLFYTNTGSEMAALLEFLTAGSACIAAVEPALHMNLSRTGTSGMGTYGPSNYPELKTTLNEFERIVGQYRKRLVQRRRHMRQTADLYELAANARNICAQPHTGLLRKVMIRLFRCFADCLERCNRRMEKLTPEDFDEIQQMQQSVDELQRRVISFLTDLSHSDGFFMDRERYNHPSVSSAASLLLGYNLWLNDFADAVGRATQETNNTYAYLVTSGGCDETLIFNPFYFLRPWNAENGRIPEHLPLIVQMSEMSLFDFSGTILRGAHECMHHCGERNRAGRYKFYIGFIARFYAEKLANAIFDQGELEHAYGHMYRLISAEDIAESTTEAMKCDILDAYGTIKEDFVHGIENVLRSLLQRTPGCAASTQLKKRGYLTKYVLEDISGLLFCIFSVYEWHEVDGLNKRLRQNAFSIFLYDTGQNAEAHFTQRCADILEANDIDTMCFSFEKEKLQVFQRLDAEEQTDWQPHNRPLWIKVEAILTQILKREPLLKKTNMGYLTEFEKIIPYAEYISSGTFLASVGDIFSETFADVAACTILGAEIEDYILMHVFETWSVPEALDSESFSSKFRIPAVLYVCFPKCVKDGKLTESARNRIGTAVQRLANHGLKENRINAEELCNAVNKLLGKWESGEQKIGGTGKYLLGYLRECKRIYARQEIRRTLACYAKSFQKLRLWGDGDPAKVLELFYELVNWNGGLEHGWTGLQKNALRQ